MGSRAIIFILFIFLTNICFAESENVKIFTTNKNQAELVILDKITSKKILYTAKINEVHSVYKLNILVKRCVLNNSKGYLEVLAYVQIQDDLKIIKNKDKIFLYNGWMIANHPSLNSLEHANYDVWVKNCY